jgi:hypothetical protein
MARRYEKCQLLNSLRDFRTNIIAVLQKPKAEEKGTATA